MFLTEFHDSLLPPSNSWTRNGNQLPRIYKQGCHCDQLHSNLRHMIFFWLFWQRPAHNFRNTPEIATTVDLSRHEPQNAYYCKQILQWAPEDFQQLHLLKCAWLWGHTGCVAREKNWFLITTWSYLCFLSLIIGRCVSERRQFLADSTINISQTPFPTTPFRVKWQAGQRKTHFSAPKRYYEHIRETAFRSWLLFGFPLTIYGIKLRGG